MADTQSEESFRQELQRIKDDLSRLRADVAEMTGTLRELGLGKAANARRSVEEDLKQARDEILRRASAVQDSAERAVDGLGTGIGERPFTSLLTAFGVGFIIAKLLGARGQR
jgi:ElaB/YqjD/DUF883 family membrane-anchored ribosome-binding protein